MQKQRFLFSSGKFKESLKCPALIFLCFYRNMEPKENESNPGRFGI